MILVDPRDGADKQHKASTTLVRYIRQRGIPAEICRLKYGDLAFNGYVPKGQGMIGFERKTLYDILDCIDSKRLSAYQVPGMRKMYSLHFVIIEGLWRSDEQGLLMEGYKDGYSWRWTAIKGRKVLYSKLYRYLISLKLAGTDIIYSSDIQHTAWNICEYYRYFEKRWEDHKSMLEMCKPVIPSIDGKPSLVRKWASDIDGVGPELSGQADKIFGSGLELALGTEDDWEQIRGIGRPSAIDIVKQIEGRK